MNYRLPLGSKKIFFKFIEHPKFITLVWRSEIVNLAHETRYTYSYLHRFGRIIEFYMTVICL